MCIMLPSHFSVEAAKTLERQLKKYGTLRERLLPIVKKDLEEYRLLNLPETDESWKERKTQRIYLKVSKNYMNYLRIWKRVY